MKLNKTIKGKVPNEIENHLQKIIHDMNELVKPFSEEKQNQIWAEIEKLDPLICQESVMNKHFHLLKEELSQLFSSLEKTDLIIDHCMKIKEDLLEL